MGDEDELTRGDCGVLTRLNGPDSDLAYQSDIKGKLFSLAEARASLCALGLFISLCKYTLVYLSNTFQLLHVCFRIIPPLLPLTVPLTFNP